jgi:hypothetical protein
MLQVVLALAQRVDPASYRGPPLANVQVKPCNKSCIDLPATGSQPPLDGLMCAEHYLMFDAHEAPAAV